MKVKTEVTVDIGLLENEAGEVVMGKKKVAKVRNRPDGLHPRVLMEIAEENVEALEVIFQESLKSRRVPEDWEMANVTPLFNKGRKQKIGNKRPVNLTSVVGKILESVIMDEIAEYLEVH
eukprot:g30962.t1